MPSHRLRLRQARRSTSPAANIFLQQQQGFVPTQPGDPDFSLATTPDTQAQFPAAAAERRLYENRTSARNVLDQARMAGTDISQPQFDPIHEVAEKGFGERALTLGENLINFIDGPREAINLLFQDLAGGAAEEGKRDPTLSDYLDALFMGIKDQEGFTEATGLDPDSGSYTLDLFGWDEAESWYGKVGRGIATFGFEVLTDPVTYLTFGLSGLGRKVAKATADKFADDIVKQIVPAFKAGTLDPSTLTSPYARRTARNLQATVDDFVKKHLDNPDMAPDVQRALSRFLTDKKGLDVPDDPWAMMELVQGNVVELAIRNQIRDEVMAPLLRRDFAAIAKDAFDDLPKYAYGGARISFPFTKAGLSRGITIPGTQGLGKKLVGDHLRKVSAGLKKTVPGYNKLAKTMKNIARNLDQDKPLLEGLARAEGGIEGWQYHILQTAQDRMTNLEHKERIFATMNALGDNVRRAMRDAGVEDEGQVWAAVLERMERSDADTLLRENLGPIFAGTPQTAGLHDALDKEVTKMAEFLRDTLDSYYEALRGFNPRIMEQYIEGYVPHVIEDEVGLVLSELAGKGGVIGRKEWQAMQAQGNPGGVLLDNLLNAIGKGGRIESQLGASRYFNTRSGRMNALTLTDGGTTLFDADFIKAAKASAQGFLTKEGEVLPDALQSTYFTVTELNEMIGPLVERLAKEYDVVLPRNWQGQVFKTNPLDIVFGYVNNLDEVVTSWNLMDALRTAGLAFEHSTAPNVQDMLQSMYRNTMKLYEDMTVPGNAAPPLPREAYGHAGTNPGAVVDADGNIALTYDPEVAGFGAPAAAPTSQSIPSVDEFANTGEVLFHGTPREFDTFDTSRAGYRGRGTGGQRPQAGAKFYFSRDPQVASRFAEQGSTAEVGLSDILDEIGAMSWDDVQADDLARLFTKDSTLLISKGFDDAGEAVWSVVNSPQQFKQIVDSAGLAADEITVRRMKAGRAGRVIRQPVFGKTIDLRDAVRNLDSYPGLREALLADDLIDNYGTTPRLRGWQQHEDKFNNTADWMREHGYGKAVVPDSYESGGESVIGLAEFIGKDAAEVHSRIYGKQAAPTPSAAPTTPLPTSHMEALHQLGRDVGDANTAIINTVTSDGMGSVTAHNWDKLPAVTRQRVAELMKHHGHTRFRVSDAVGSRVLDVDEALSKATTRTKRVLKGYEDYVMSGAMPRRVITATTKAGFASVDDARDIFRLIEKGQDEFRKLREHPLVGRMDSAAEMGTYVARKGEPGWGVEIIDLPGGSRAATHTFRDDAGDALVELNLEMTADGPLLSFQHVRPLSGREALRVGREVMEQIDRIVASGDVKLSMNNLRNLMAKETMTDQGADMVYRYLRNKLRKLDPDVKDIITGNAEVTDFKTMYDDFVDELQLLFSEMSAIYDAELDQFITRAGGKSVAAQLAGDNVFMKRIKNLRDAAKAMNDQHGFETAMKVFTNIDDFMGLADQPGFVNPRWFALGGPAIEGMVVQPDIGLWLRQMSRNMASIYTPEGVAALKMASNSVLKWWKGMATIARPSFHIRNLVGGVWNGMIVGVGPQHYLATRTHGIKLRNALREGLDFEEALMKLPAKERVFWQAAWENDVLSGFVSTEFRKLTTAQKQSRLAWAKAWDVDQFVLTRAGGRFMESIEDFMRMSTFRAWFDPNDPSTAKIAKEMVEAVHFNYNKLTPMETRIKSLVPFFVWSRRNLPLQLAQFAENPRMIQRYRAMLNSMNDNFEEDNPLATSDYYSAFAADTGFTVNAGTPYWARVMIDPDLPVRDLVDLPMPGIQGLFDFANNLLGPHVTTMFDLNNQREFGDVNAPAPFNLVAQSLAAVGFYDKSVTGDVRIPYFHRTIMETALPFAREVIDPLTGGPTDPNRQARLGISPEDNPLEAAIKTLGGTLARGLGVQMSTPADSRAASFRSKEELDALVAQLRLQGQIPPSQPGSSGFNLDDFLLDIGR